MPAFQSHASDSFWTCYKNLPTEIQKLADKAYELFKENPAHPSLQFKKVGKKQPVYSARITDFYRALCVLSGDNAYWFWIGDHDSYQKMINRV